MFEGKYPLPRPVLDILLIISRSRYIQACWETLQMYLEAFQGCTCHSGKFKTPILHSYGKPLHQSRVDSREGFGVHIYNCFYQMSMAGVHQVETIVIHSSPIQMGVSTTNFNFANILSLFLKQLPFGPSAHKWGGKSPQHVLVFTHTLSLFLFWLDPKPIRLLLFYTPRPWASRNAGR